MNTLTRRDRIAGSLHNLGASWWSIGLFAVVLSLVNGFLITSMQWTVGAIERLSPPFEQWMFNTLTMIPVYAIAIVGSLYLARRLSRSGGRVRRLWTAVGTILLAGIVVGMAHMAISSAYDYWLQIRHIGLSAHLRHPLYRVEGTTPVLVGSPTCDATCQAIAATRDAHLRGFVLMTKLFLVVDGIFVLWTLALRGGVVWVSRPTRRVDSPTAEIVPAAAGAPTLVAG